MKVVTLTRGKVALVSDRDWPLVRQFKWCAWSQLKAPNNWYAVRCIRYGKGGLKKRHISMARLIKGNPPCDVDHRNCNGLDNRRHNLRLASRSQNNANQRRSRVNTSGHKGVSRADTRSVRWRARVMLNKKEIHAGIFKTKREAAAAYAALARKLFGQFARSK